MKHFINTFICLLIVLAVSMLNINIAFAQEEKAPMKVDTSSIEKAANDNNEKVKTTKIEILGDLSEHSFAKDGNIYGTETN